MLSRREFFTHAGLAGLASVAPSIAAPGTDDLERSGGTPEQIHLTWGEDPATSVCISWCSPAQSVQPRIILDSPTHKNRVVHALQRRRADVGVLCRDLGKPIL